jgi:hypothetical protein
VESTLAWEEFGPGRANKKSLMIWEGSIDKAALYIPTYVS